MCKIGADYDMDEDFAISGYIRYYMKDEMDEEEDVILRMIRFVTP